MGNRGRFGKYGEIKRNARLRQARKSGLTSIKSSFKSKKSRPAPWKRTGHGPNVTFREGTYSDEIFITQLSGMVFSVFGPYEELVPKWIGYESTVTIIACVDGSPAGFAMIGDPFNRYDIQWVTELLAIAVEPKNQNQGIGTLLLKEVDKRVAELHIKRIFLHTATDNYSARRLFLKAGYRPWQIKRAFYPAGQDAIVMSKEPQ